MKGWKAERKTQGEKSELGSGPGAPAVGKKEKSQAVPPAQTPKGRQTSQKPAKNEKEEQGTKASTTKAKRVNRTKMGAVQVQYVSEPAFKQQDKPKPEDTSQGYQPATLTGFRELPIRKAFFILILWLPRLFIPWILAWHEFNVYVLSNPWHWTQREGEIPKHKTIVLAVKSVITVVYSVIVDLARKKWEVDFGVYQFLLGYNAVTPLVGGLVDVLLRGGFYEKQSYKDWWFTSIVLMQWAMSTSFVMFPVQFACIYTQNDKMSRNAHYNWTSVFVLLESMNALIAYLAIPIPCPIRPWTQITVWAAIFLLMITLAILTPILLFVIEALKYVRMICCKGTTHLKHDLVPDKPDHDPFVDAPFAVWTKKLMWFSMIAVPVICSYFSFSVIERFPHENWNVHHFRSATGLYLFGKILGVMLMVSVMLISRKVYARWNPSSLKMEMLFLGVPHSLFILALITLVGRFSTLSHPEEGDIIGGPVPIQDKSVLLFTNAGYRNMTYCIRSEYFEPTRIRPLEYVTKEINGTEIGTDSFNVSMEVDPSYEPVIKRNLYVKNITNEGVWKIFRIDLEKRNFSNVYVWDFYRTLRSTELRETGGKLPKLGAPDMMIFQLEDFHCPLHKYFYRMDPKQVDAGNLSLKSQRVQVRHRNLVVPWEVPAIGTWTVVFWFLEYDRNALIREWVAKCSPCTIPLDFAVENNTLYLLVEYFYQENLKDPLWPYLYDRPPVNLPHHNMPPYHYVLFKLAEIAGPNSTRLPSNQQLERDGVVRTAMVLAGMAAGGIFLGFVYLFWVDPPLPRYRLSSLAVFWALVGILSEIPRIKQIDVVKASPVLLCLQIFMTGSHFFGAFLMYSPTFNFRTRPD